MAAVGASYGGYLASILLGQKCGVCHGKVAFPVSECRACHSRKKTSAVAQGGEAK